MPKRGIRGSAKRDTRRNAEKRTSLETAKRGTYRNAKKNTRGSVKNENLQEWRRREHGEMMKEGK